MMKPNDISRVKTTCGFDKTSRAKGLSMDTYQKNAETEPQTEGQNPRENGKRRWSGKRAPKNPANRSTAHKKTVLGRRTVS
jgi:hypothetical protein